MNDQKWTAMNLAWRTYEEGATVIVSKDGFIAADYSNTNQPNNTRDGGEVNTTW